MSQPNYATISGLANPLSPATEDQRFAALDWLEEDPNEDHCYSHVFLYRGYDLTAAGIYTHDIAPCLLCEPLPPFSEPALYLSDETLSYGRLIHYAGCANCGTRGPWSTCESGALAQWNAAHERHTVKFGCRQTQLKGLTMDQGTHEAPPPIAWGSDALCDVAAERRRQIEAEGYDPAHDDAHVNDEIAAAACFYAMPPGAREWDASSTGYGRTLGLAIIPEGWTMTEGNRRRELVKAGALILAEIERLDRATT